MPSVLFGGRLTRAPRLGKASGALVLAVIGLGLALYVLLRLFGSSTETGAGVDAQALEPAREESSSEPGPRGSMGTGAGASASEQAGPSRAHEELTARMPSFDGIGSLRGMVSVGGGKPLPETLIVHVGPSDSLGGRELAETRSLEVRGAEFAFDELPLGGYDVWVDAVGMNSRRTPVLLSESAPDPYVVVRVSPTGYLDGFAVCHDGRPAQELRVVLEARHSQDRLETTTRADGFYRFASVPDGEYSILFGPLHAPLLPARELVFQAPSMRFPKTELPPTADVLFHTTDGAGRALAEVTLSGFGRPQGRIDLVTDLEGRGWARNLLPGRYKVSARNAQGLRGTVPIEVTLEAGQEHWLALR